VPQEDARDQGQDEAGCAEYLAQPPVRAGGVPLVEQFVQDLGDPVVDRVAEMGQELFLGFHGEALGIGLRARRRGPGCRQSAIRLP
jgi:hypothetical protein